jgi:hypothetical protein
MTARQARRAPLSSRCSIRENDLAALREKIRATWTTKGVICCAKEKKKNRAAGSGLAQENRMRAARALLMLALWIAAPAFAQAPPSYPPTQLDRLVARVALYPDPLLAQLLAASTFADEIPAAARWADQHRALAGQALADAMRSDELPWDPSVEALLPFASVLDRMASDASWTAELGDAFLAQQQDVMAAVQRQRQRARDFGYLRSTGPMVVDAGPYITVGPLNPTVIVVPSYDPDIVFSAPRPGVAVAEAIRFEGGVALGGFRPYGWDMGKFDVLGGFFRPWGWGASGFDWGAHTLIINNAAWLRTWTNRHDYVHPYPGLRRVR